MDAIQIIIIFVSITLTSIIAILSIQVWNILKEFRGSIVRMNKMLDDTGKITETAAHTVEGISGALSGLRGVFSLLSSFRKKGETA